MPPTVVRLSAGREFRIQVDGTAATLALWQPAETGRGSLGEVELDTQALRQVIRALKVALWRCERAEATHDGAGDHDDADVGGGPGRAPPLGV